MTPMSETDFLDYVRDILDIDDPIALDTNLLDEFNIDSLSVYELMIAFEDDFGVEIDEESWVQARTVGDYFLIHRKLTVGGPGRSDRTSTDESP
jgi:acyl carrier protein